MIVTIYRIQINLVYLEFFTETKILKLTNANRQRLQNIPRNSNSALMLSTLGLLVTLEVEMCYPTTSSSLLIHSIPAVPRHQLVLRIVPLYWSGHCSCGLRTEHSLSHPDSQRQIRRIRQASPAILQESSRRCSVREDVKRNS